MRPFFLTHLLTLRIRLPFFICLALMGNFSANMYAQDDADCVPTLAEGLSYSVYNYDSDQQAEQADAGQFAFVLEAPAAEGLVESRWYGWSEEPGQLKVASDGKTATLTGTIVSIDERSFRGTFPGNPELKFEVNVVFTLQYNSALEYLAEKEVNIHHPISLMSNLGRYIKVPWQYTEEVMAHLEDMQLWGRRPRTKHPGKYGKSLFR